MTKFFNLLWPDSDRLKADNNKAQGKWVRNVCPLTGAHSDGNPRISDLYHEVKHNKRDERMIWGAGVSVHQSLVEEFAKEGFTGYRLKPALVRFRDGSTSDEYHEFVVTGWAGMASPESGIKLLESCPACEWKKYSAITDFDKVIDWSQWTGDDFFIVWPMGWRLLCTERVARWLVARQVKSFYLEEGFADITCDPIIAKLGYIGQRLTNYLPEDLAIKYGKPLGLE